VQILSFLLYAGGRKDPPELLIAAFIGLALGLWMLRRSERAAMKGQQEIETRADKNEITEDEAASLVINHRFRQATQKLMKTLCIFLLTIGATTPFLAGFPLHEYWHPWGECALLGCFAVFIIMVLSLGSWMSEWFARHEARQAMR
jgi:hypothetical protein